MVTTPNEDNECKEGTTLLEDIANSVNRVGNMITGLYESVNTILESSADIQDLLSNRMEYQAGVYGYDDIANGAE